MVGATCPASLSEESLVERLALHFSQSRYSAAVRACPPRPQFTDDSSDELFEDEKTNHVLNGSMSRCARVC